MGVYRQENQLSKVIRQYNWKHHAKFPTVKTARRCFLMCYVWEFFDKETQQFDIQAFADAIDYTYRAAKYIIDNQLDLKKYTSRVRGGLIKEGKLDIEYSQKRIQLMQYHQCHSVAHLIQRYVIAGFDVPVIGMLLGYRNTRYQTIRKVIRDMQKSQYNILLEQGECDE